MMAHIQHPTAALEPQPPLFELRTPAFRQKQILGVT
jgi:hypothetical protein